MVQKIYRDLSTLGSLTGFGRGCQCAKGTQDTESTISTDTLKPDGALITSANKETKRKLHTVF